MEPIIVKMQHFVRLSDDDKKVLTNIARYRVRRYAAREDVIREGDRPKNINLIREGWACRYKMLPDGRRQIVGFFLPGDLCDLNIFILKYMDHSIGSLTPLTVAEIDKQSFDELIQKHPRITQALWWESLVSIATQREWTVNLGQRDALERMAHLFCELFVRSDAAGRLTGQSCDFPLTQTDLGDTLGLSSVHVNRTLQELRSRKLLSLKSKRLTIPDIEALKEFALFNDGYLHLGNEGRELDAND